MTTNEAQIYTVHVEKLDLSQRGDPIARCIIDGVSPLNARYKEQLDYTPGRDHIQGGYTYLVSLVRGNLKKDRNKVPKTGEWPDHYFYNVPQGWPPVGEPTPPDTQQPAAVAPQSPAQQQKPVSGGRTPVAPIGDARETGIRAAVAYGKAVELFGVLAANDGDFLNDVTGGVGASDWLRDRAAGIFDDLIWIAAGHPEEPPAAIVDAFDQLQSAAPPMPPQPRVAEAPEQQAPDGW